MRRTPSIPVVTANMAQTRSAFLAPGTNPPSIDVRESRLTEVRRLRMPSQMMKAASGPSVKKRK